MSLSLDGRLPSGRRTALLRHIAECASCGRTWDGMKEAQDVALSLSGHRVSGVFRQGLGRRIEAGEGTPEAAYGAAISGFGKLRYVVTGAAAAALVIVALRLFGGGEVSPERPPTEDGLVARVTEQPTAQPALVNGVELASLNEYSLAKNCVNKTARSALRLRARMSSLGERPLNETWDEVEDVLVDFKAAVGVLQWMDRKRILTLPRPMQNEFREAEVSFNQIFAGPSWEVRGAALRRLQDMELERVRTNIDISCCRPAEDLFLELGELVDRMPEARKLFRIDNIRSGMVPGQRMTILLRLDTEAPTGQ